MCHRDYLVLENVHVATVLGAGETLLFAVGLLVRRSCRIYQCLSCIRMVGMVRLACCILELMLTILACGFDPSKRCFTVAVIVALVRLLFGRGVLGGSSSWRNEGVGDCACVDFLVVLYVVW